MTNHRDVLPWMKIDVIVPKAYALKAETILFTLFISTFFWGGGGEKREAVPAVCSKSVLDRMGLKIRGASFWSPKPIPNPLILTQSQQAHPLCNVSLITGLIQARVWSLFANNLTIDLFSFILVTALKGQFPPQKKSHHLLTLYRYLEECL